MVDLAKSSRRLPVQRRRAWRAGFAQTEEEAREYLQKRLAVFCKLLFWSFAALLVFLFGMYELYPRVEPVNQGLVNAVSIGSLAILAFVWRIVLVRKTLSVETLHVVDLIIMIGSGTTFGTDAALAFDLQASSYTCLLYSSFVVFTRALVVPSSTRRTAILSSLTFIPIVGGAVILGFIGKDWEIPGPAFVAGDILYNAVAVALATTGSRIIYGLSQKLTEATKLGQYTLDRKIGAGGMGAVYHAKHALLRRPTAIKLMLPNLGADALDRFEREVQLMSQLSHPNTVAVFDFGRNLDGALYYAMEYLDGLNLEQLVVQFGPQSANRIVHILVQVCGALQEAHDAGMIHRDIKPANIILCERGGLPDVAKVVDYGLVKEVARDAEQSTQIILGTPSYIAPEAVLNAGPLTPSVDLYALGAVGFFLLTGKRVFQAKTNIETCIQHVMQQPKRPSEVATLPIPPHLEEVIMKCLSKSPGDRYASARELAEALDQTPRSADWDRDEAIRWWREYRLRIVTPPPSSDAETLTIDVDLGART